MIAELFSMLSTLEANAKNGEQKFTVNLNRNHIRSISAFSSNSIFYFTTIVSDQATPEEVAMGSRMLEKSYASFVVTCISLMPFHRIKADDKASIEEYLSQFHQNLGIDVDSKSGVVFGKVLGFADSLDEAVQLPVNESSKGRVNDDGDEVPNVCPKCGSKIGVFLKGEPVYLCTNKKCGKYFGVVPFNESVDAALLKQTQDFLLECWEKSRRNCTNFIKIVSETVSLNDMFSVNPVDPMTRVFQEAYLKNLDELNTWGFIGEATADMFDTNSEELEALTDEEIIQSVLSSRSDEDDDDSLEDEYSEYDDMLDEGAVCTLNESITSTINTMIGKLADTVGANKNNAKPRSEQVQELAKDMKPNIHAFNYQRAYNGSYMTLDYDETPENVKWAAKWVCADAQLVCGAQPKEFMIVKVKDYRRITGIPADACSYDDNATLLMFSLDFLGKQFSAAQYKDAYDARYFNDIVDNDVRRAMENDLKFKPKVKVDMDAIRAGYKYLHGTDMPISENYTLDEAGTVKTAINSIMFSLEAVSENKILSCSSLTKLNALESKLNKLKNKYAKYLTRYKKQYNENKKNGTKKKLAIRFNGASISNPRAFMKQYGAYIKIINKRLKLVDKRRAELRKRKGLPAGERIEESAVMTALSDLDLQNIDRILEAADKQLMAPDSEAFIITEDADDDVDYDQFIPNPDEEYEDRIDRLSTAYQQAEARRKVAEARADRLERVNQNIKQSSKDYKRKAQAVSTATHQAKRYQNLYDNEKKARVEAEKKAAAAAKNQKPSDDPDLKVGDISVDTRYDRRRPKSGVNYARAAARGYEGTHTFSDKVFTDMDMKKANEAIPTFTRATIGFIVDETEQVVNRDVLVGIKVQVHRCPAKDLVDDIYNCLINKRKFLKFVKFISGEEKSLADLLFGFKELKLDAVNSTGAKRWNSAFRRRRRWSKMSVPYLMKNYTPNGTVIITMNEVQFIRDEYGIDIMTPEHVRMLMDAGFLLGFVVLDQANEMCYITYDGHNGEFQEYTYAMLEREQQTTDRMMRELYRSMSR